MKTIRNLILVSFALLATAGVFAKPPAGPKGGRLLTTEAPHAEFFVEKDRTVAVTFYDKDLKPVAPGDQVVNAIAEAKTGKVKLEFEKTATGFVSKQPLPEGDDYTVVVQIRDTAGAKPKNHRVLFHDEVCDECKRAEYACSCEH
ncbi:MAG TPA: hypothetical protein VIO38_06365 [Rariglobus sp.]